MVPHDDFDFESWNKQVDGVEDQYQPKELILKIEDFLNEVAFHEAGHFVFNIMITSISDDFHEPTGITVEVIEGFPFKAMVEGFQPEIFKRGKSPIRAEEKETFYEDDPRIVFLYSFSLLAGYVTYSVFIDRNSEEEYFSYIEETDKESLKATVPIKYFNHKKALRSRDGIKDLYQLKKTLIHAGYTDNTDRLEMEKKFIEATQTLMNVQAVNDSIRFIRNILVKQKGEHLSDKEFIRIKREVRRFTGKASMKLMGIIDNITSNHHI